MSCSGINRLNPICLPGEVVNNVANDAFTNIARSFGRAAAQTTTWLWQQIDVATRLDLTSPALVQELTMTGGIAGVLCLALFVVQVIKGALWRDPGALRRGVVGLAIAFIGSAFALATTRVLLTAVDALSAGVVQETMGTNISGLGKRLLVINAEGQINPAVLLIFSLLVIAACIMVWAAMMVRKLMLLVAAILAPLAFAGATADFSRAWVRRWIEFVAAMIACKLLLVIMMSIGVTVLDGGGSRGHGATQTITQLAGGALVLLMAGLSPWIAVKMFGILGESMHTAHMAAMQTTSGARTVIAAPQKVQAVTGRVASFVPTPAGQAAGGAARGMAAARGAQSAGLRLSAARIAGSPNSVGATGKPAISGDPLHADAGGGVGAGAGRTEAVAAAATSGPAPAQPSTQPTAATPEPVRPPHVGKE